uniref:PDZ domain-containing protein n=1 Tax=Zooxanthella nutricula TaxID=1333877 RepID=A0A7S2KRY1_9DINO
MFFCTCCAQSEIAADLDLDAAASARVCEADSELTVPYVEAGATQDPEQEGPKDVPEKGGADGAFVITLNKGQGKYGIDVAPKLDRAALRVAAINDAGLVAEWNAANPSSALRANDEILAAGGIRTSSQAIVDALNVEGPVEVLIQPVQK